MVRPRTKRGVPCRGLPDLRKERMSTAIRMRPAASAGALLIGALLDRTAWAQAPIARGSRGMQCRAGSAWPTEESTRTAAPSSGSRPRPTATATCDPFSLFVLFAGAADQHHVDGCKRKTLRLGAARRQRVRCAAPCPASGARSPSGDSRVVTCPLKAAHASLGCSSLVEASLCRRSIIRKMPRGSRSSRASAADTSRRRRYCSQVAGRPAARRAASISSSASRADGLPRRLRPMEFR